MCVLPGDPSWIQEAGYLEDGFGLLGRAAEVADVRGEADRYVLSDLTYRIAAEAIGRIKHDVLDHEAGQPTACLYVVQAFELDALWKVLGVLRRARDGEDRTTEVRELNSSPFSPSHPNPEGLGRKSSSGRFLGSLINPPRSCLDRGGHSPCRVCFPSLCPEGSAGFSAVVRRQLDGAVAEGEQAVVRAVGLKDSTWDGDGRGGHQLADLGGIGLSAAGFPSQTRVGRAGEWG
ncbi:hypothetical protein ACQEVY_00315 [Streptomyces sp. CA-288835]|uniref:hypothetical protein n=1 Tax=Streptomyces sp. CA-288835 TaxID=3240069 RepID=UPI003D938C86